MQSLTMNRLQRLLCLAFLGGLGPLVSARGLDLGVSVLVLPVLQISDHNASTGFGPGLCWGDILPGATAGTVTVAKQGAGYSATKTGGVTLATYNTIGHVRAAAFDVTGSGRAAVAFTYPANAQVITLTGPGGATMTATNWKAMDLVTNTTAPVTTNPLPAVLASGSNTFYVSATLNVGANQKPGDYAGIFNVSVNYN